MDMRWCATVNQFLWMMSWMYAISIFWPAMQVITLGSIGCTRMTGIAFKHLSGDYSITTQCQLGSYALLLKILGVADVVRNLFFSCIQQDAAGERNREDSTSTQIAIPPSGLMILFKH